MTLPPLYEDLVDRLWEALHEAPDTVPTALISKGPAADITDGLSDLDFRLLIDARGPEDWQRAKDAFYRVFTDFAHEHPKAWRIIEHPPGRNVEPHELDKPAVMSERYEWDVLRTDDKGLAPRLTVLDTRMQDQYLRKLLWYRDAYDAAIDPPVNISAVNLPRYRLYSICWHYYAAAIRFAALTVGVGTVRGKWDAVRWRADAGSSTAKDVLAAAEVNFEREIDDIAARCEEDIVEVARSVADAEDPWPVIQERAIELEPTHEEWLFHLISANRLSMTRLRFYIDAPEGYDLEAVLRIDRGHIHNYLAGPLDDEGWVAKLREHAEDQNVLEQSIAFFQTQYRATEMGSPREIFEGFCDNYVSVWGAMENWYARS